MRDNVKDNWEDDEDGREQGLWILEVVEEVKVDEELKDDRDVYDWCYCQC
ncbi:hypothetical protein PPACK8108_LOCUS9574 [Phakopsora pachyrhizi]|uniref:Uncharacterized protein n=1 Tax=Phakopsora pachyrhizi TaxID=170000 RepID=A0AAV0AWQ8_PHAPC|nr:hypothetical protein PPACK8108_LOCUS9574 [Phakopsora pachyrhizi]